MTTPVDSLLQELEEDGETPTYVGAAPQLPADAIVADDADTTTLPPAPIEAKAVRMLPPPGGPHSYGGMDATGGVDVMPSDVPALEAEGWTKEGTR